MSSDENTPIITGQKRQAALQLGPRKKPYVASGFRAFIRIDFNVGRCHIAPGQTRLYIMAGILDVLSMPCAP
jgi:hypothetical protein